MLPLELRVALRVSMQIRFLAVDWRLEKNILRDEELLVPSHLTGQGLAALMVAMTRKLVVLRTDLSQLAELTRSLTPELLVT